MANGAKNAVLKALFTPLHLEGSYDFQKAITKGIRMSRPTNPQNNKCIRIVNVKMHTAYGRGTVESKGI